MGEIAKSLIILGAALIVIGLVLLGLQKLTFFHGRFPGDILIKRENFTFYFPLGLSIIISILVSLILYILGKFK